MTEKLHDLEREEDSMLLTTAVPIMGVYRAPPLHIEINILGDTYMFLQDYWKQSILFVSMTSYIPCTCIR